MGAAKRLDQLLAFVHVGRMGSDAIREEVAEFLYRRDPEFLKALPQHREPTPMRWEHSLARGHARSFSPLLDSLLTKDVLRKHRFIARRAAA